jgi:mannose-6-phosphate isomerase-like protein (cupin superfamily)
MGPLIKKFLSFESIIDFNFISNLLNRNNLSSLISSNWIERFVLESVFKIENVENDVFFKDVYEMLNKQFNNDNKKSDIFLFFSLTSGNKSITHRDNHDVFIINLYGKTLYVVEEKEFLLEKGDLLCIKKNQLHKAIGLTPRIILSYGTY